MSNDFTVEVGRVMGATDLLLGRAMMDVITGQPYQQACISSYIRTFISIILYYASCFISME